MRCVEFFEQFMGETSYWPTRGHRTGPAGHRYPLHVFASCVAYLLLTLSANTFASLPTIPETFELSDPQPGTADDFGSSVASQGNIAVVGMQGSIGRPGPVSAAFVYNNQTGQLLQTLVPVTPDRQNSFGSAVAIDGNYVVVGSRFEDIATPGGTQFNAGAARVFNLSTGQEITRLVPNDPAGNGFLGSAVAIEGTNVLIGGSAGAAYLFNGLTGQQLAKFVPPTPSSQFGESVALHGSTALIGAGSDASLGAYTGAAYVFDIASKSQLRKIIPADAAAGDNFGLSVALDGTTAIIGSPLHTGNGPHSGAAYVFDTTSGQQLAELIPPVPPVSNVTAAFGNSVDIEGNLAVAGAPDDSRRGLFAGGAFVFDWTKSTAIAELLPDNNHPGDSFGGAIALSNTSVIASALRNNKGSAYIFSVPEPSTCVLIAIALGVCFVRRSLNVDPH